MRRQLWQLNSKPASAPLQAFRRFAGLRIEDVVKSAVLWDAGWNAGCGTDSLLLRLPVSLRFKSLTLCFEKGIPPSSALKSSQPYATPVRQLFRSSWIPWMLPSVSQASLQEWEPRGQQQEPRLQGEWGRQACVSSLLAYLASPCEGWTASVELRSLRQQLLLCC